MWLTSSSIGRKFVMALTGICLVLFVTFHVLMNSVAIVWPAAYNQICMFLGANWYALVASIGLAALFIIHIIYAVWLTILNRKARGNSRYCVTSRPPQVEWSSKNMLVLGIVILAFLVVHLIQFWARMQWAEISGCTYTVDGVEYAPEFGTLFLQAAFSLVWTPIVYIIGFIALWFHMTHGFWSMFHSIGWDNTVWQNRLKCIGNWWTTIVIALFVAQAIVFTVKANNNDYLTDPKLQEQYAEGYGEKAAVILDKFSDFQMSLYNEEGMTPATYQEKIMAYAQNELYPNLKPIVEAAQKLCPEAKNEHLQQAMGLYQQLQQLFPQLNDASQSVEIEEDETEVEPMVEPDAEVVDVDEEEAIVEETEVPNN